MQTLSQNSGSAKDSDDSNSYDSPTSSPRNVSKLIQSDEIIKPVSAILEQMKNNNKLSEDIYVKKTSMKEIFEPSRRLSDEVTKDKKLVETMFGARDLEKPVLLTPEKAKSVTNLDEKSSKDVFDGKVVEKIEEKSASVSDEEKSGTLPLKPVNTLTTDEKPVNLSTTDEKPLNLSIIDGKPVNLSTTDGKLVNLSIIDGKPVNPSITDGKLVNPVPEGKPQIAAKPVLGQKFFDKPVTPLNLRAVLQNGLNLKTTFKLRPMLSLSR